MRNESTAHKKKIKQKRINHKAKLDRLFSEYVRRRDADSNGYIRCISCGKRVHWKEADAGHYIPRSHKSTRWHEKNVNAQCKECNQLKHGNITRYTKGLVRRYGYGIPEELRTLKNKVFRVSPSWLTEQIMHYKAKIKNEGSGISFLQ